MFSKIIKIAVSSRETVRVLEARAVLHVSYLPVCTSLKLVAIFWRYTMGCK